MENVMKEHIKDFQNDITFILGIMDAHSNIMVQNIEKSNFSDIIDGIDEFATNSNEKFDKTIYFASILFLIAAKYKMLESLEKDETDLDKLINQIFSEEIAGEIILNC